MIDRVAMKRWDDACRLEFAVNEGRQEGRQEGVLENKRQTVITSLKAGLSVDLITQITELTKKEVEEIRAKTLPLN